jgi:23S rRNA (guanosine2251-2'-O)-methyltransferase
MKKPNLGKLLTIYGRKPVLEALQDNSLQLFRLHIADSNRREGTLLEIERLAKHRHMEIQTHSKLELSRISKNSQQDQGVALDIVMPGFQKAEEFLQQLPASFQLIAVDGVTNPQNLGMIIRSVCASKITALLLPEKGCAKLDALVIKASAGTLLKCPVIRCGNLRETLKLFLEKNTTICLLDSHSKNSLFDYYPGNATIYVIGNETDGVSKEIRNLASCTAAIPLHNGVESLNVAVTAALIAFITAR